MSTLFLVQIPQTAGTSLRLAGCRLWGSNRIVCDHGADSRHTSPVVEELVYLEQDHHRFKEYLHKENIALLTSTQPLGGLRRIFPASHIVTFVRQPVERLLMEFQQSPADKHSEADFIRFCRRSENQNTQTRFLREIPLELYGFVGISERYAESLQLLNAEFGYELTELGSSSKPSRASRSGASKTKQPKLKMSLSKKTIKIVSELNKQDIQLYTLACEQFETRLNLSQARADYIHGKVNQLTREKICGWAVSTQDHNPCKVRVLVNKECIAVTAARDYLGTLKERNVSRDGYVGFSVRFPRKLKPGDTVSCYIHPTDQLLGGPRKLTTGD